MRQNPERLAWSIILIAFVTFCVIAVGFPLLVRSYLLSAAQPLSGQVNAQQGTVKIDRAGSNRVDATGFGDPFPLESFKGDTVRTDALDEGLLSLQRDVEGEKETLTAVVIYNNSSVVVDDAYSPRFGVSSGPHETILNLIDGRVRIEVRSSSDGRPVQTQVRTDRALIRLGEGSYALEVDNQQTTATVRRGEAVIQVGDEELVLGPEQRAVVPGSGKLNGPLPAERNLMFNGDFGAGVDSGWVTISNPADGSASVSDTDGEEGQSAAQFQHDRAQPAEIGLIQTLNSNVKDLESLVFHIKVLVDTHSLSVCGSLGSECPVMVRIDYLDEAGNVRQWVHGFYAFQDPAIQLPFYCTTCPDPSSGNHSQVSAASWFLYDSPNLMEIDPPALRPAVIQSVRVYASGHSYESKVSDVELLAQE